MSGEILSDALAAQYAAPAFFFPIRVGDLRLRENDEFTRTAKALGFGDAGNLN
jgi:hypothetical protein